jgi:tRNA (mo5U34)-methyltransferase
MVPPDRLWRHSADARHDQAVEHRRMSRMLFDGLELRGKTLLDIGCWDGAYSLEATQRGATVTTDHFVWHSSGGDRRCIDLGPQHLAPSMQIVDADLAELSVERLGRFDVVLFLECSITCVIR